MRICGRLIEWSAEKWSCHTRKIIIIIIHVIIIIFQGDALCKDCFYYAFEEEIHKTIIDAKLFTRGETIAIGASGGKGTFKMVHYLKYWYYSVSVFIICKNKCTNLTSDVSSLWPAVLNAL